MSSNQSGSIDNGLDKIYQPQNYEARIYQNWQATGSFAPRGTGQPFVMVLPPPNANADLHLGYALDCQLKDVLGRWQRQQGRPVLMVPGSDHAGFETWAVYEKHLKSQNKSRFDFDRQQLYDQVYDFVQTNQTNMIRQMKQLGISCDWDRFVFSLDQPVIDYARSTFAKMYQQGLIYRGWRLVNYCLNHGTGFADFEVDYLTTSGRLYKINYPLAADPVRSVTIATSRPETLLADVALAVQYQDQRYRSLVGQKVRLPLVGRLLPVVADPAVDPDFGTGVVKITPGADFFDAELAQRHQLETIDLITTQGRLTQADWLPARYRDLTLKSARKLVVTDLKQAGLLVAVESYQQRLAVCYKCQTALEPIRLKQWFVKMTGLARTAIDCLEQNRIRFYPDSRRLELINYLKQLKDWNISRQIAWGIPIPMAQNQNDPDDWIFWAEADGQNQTTVNGQTYQSDPDVFDTWWSSGQWPWASLNWPDDNQNFYPNSLMETGVDILRPWVARMIMLGLFVTRKPPFDQVYLHGLIVDDRGQKMSKSKGNVINPITVVDQVGADALRLALLTGISPGQNQSFNQAKIRAGRNFCNKLWNIGRLVQKLRSGSKIRLLESIQLGPEPADHWFWSRFEATKADHDQALQNYRLNEALGLIHQFIWHDLADWYLEAAKVNPRLQLDQALAKSLMLVHPWLPFLSEALWLELVDDRQMLIDQQWSAGQPAVDRKLVDAFNQIQKIIKTIRSVTAGLTDDLQIKNYQLQARQLTGFETLVDQLTRLTAGPRSGQNQKQLAVGWQQNQVSACLWISSQAQDCLKTKYQKLSQDQQQQIELLQNRLANDKYCHQAPADLVAASRRQLEELQQTEADNQLILNQLDS